MTNELQENGSEVQSHRGWSTRRRIAIGSALGGVALVGSALGITSAFAGTTQPTPSAMAAAIQDGLANVQPITVEPAPTTADQISFAGLTASDAVCIRTHGVPAFPNPSAYGGVFTTYTALGASQSTVQAAITSCLGTEFDPGGTSANASATAVPAAS